MSEKIRRVPLSQLAEINPRTTLPEGVLCSFVGMEDVSEEGLLTSSKVRSSNKSAGYTRFCDGDVLFAKITPCMENGKGALALGLHSGFGFGSTEFHILRAKPAADPRFLAHWCQTKTLRNAAEAMMTGSAGQRRVPIEFFHRFLIPQIPIAEQRRIVEILDSIDESIRSTESLIAKQRPILEALKQSIYTVGLDEHGRVRGSSGEASSGFYPSAVGVIPNSWHVCLLDEVAQRGSGHTPSRRVTSGCSTPTSSL